MRVLRLLRPARFRAHAPRMALAKVDVDVVAGGPKLAEPSETTPARSSMSDVKHPPPRAPSEVAYVVRAEFKPNAELAKKIMASAREQVERVYGPPSSAPATGSTAD